MSDAILTYRPRADALPEGLRFQDDGCEVAPSCLSCPLPKCRYELHSGLHSIRAALRREEVARLRRLGLGPDDIAARLGISKRTVSRVRGERQ